MKDHVVETTSLQSIQETQSKPNQRDVGEGIWEKGYGLLDQSQNTIAVQAKDKQNPTLANTDLHLSGHFSLGMVGIGEITSIDAINN